MSNYHSFVSEHTLEYILIPRLSRILKQQFKSVVPIFPWMTREGNLLSKSLHRSDEFKIIGLFPRRPKFESGVEGKIYIKINIELIESLKIASGFNLPLIAGCPLIENLWELGDNTSCVWIKIKKNEKETYQIEIAKDANGGYPKMKSNDFFETDDQLLNYVVKNCHTFNFDHMIEIIRMINGRRNEYPSFYLGASYKPVYFLFKDIIDK
jgi:hypothetical protein